MHMSINMKNILIPLNVLNKNRRLYKRENFNPLRKEYFIEDTNEATACIRLDHVRGRVTELEFTDTALIGKVEILEIGDWKNLQALVEADALVIRPMAIANLEDEIVTNIELVGFNFVAKGEDSFNLIS